ncbi:MAG TPA: 3-hydroxyacyl-ACP dehydratase FabZ [Candidatus Sulfotelmatobacter sp.]|nr:3-hydroxyacyl-ACP dehydratase FabZ [Candidatus Sulfotelmatobacter sp.]
MAAYDVREIMRILPHRYPMLLLDRILELEPMVSARGYKNVSVNEPMLTGHFPLNPVLPGVYIIEALAQLAGTTILKPGDQSRKTPYLAGVDGFRFRRPVIPGDRLDMWARVARVKLNMGVVVVEAKVGDELVCAGELMFSVVSDPGAFGVDATVLHL